MTLRVGALLMVATMCLAGCARLGSQVEGAFTAGGDREMTVRAAAYDVLIDKAVSVKQWPQCTGVEKVVTCRGRTTDGAEIVVESPATMPVTLTVSIGGSQVFAGEALEVLDAAAGEGR